MMYTDIRTDEVMFRINLFDIRDTYTNMILDNAGFAGVDIIEV